MQKFSRSLTIGLVAVAAATLTACHPPSQQDSDVKVDNASTFTGEAPAGAAKAAATSVEPSASAAASEAYAGASAAVATAVDAVEGAADAATGAVDAVVATPAQ